VGFDLVVIVVAEVSGAVWSGIRIARRIGKHQIDVPLFSVPQTSHFKIALASPEDASRRLPQSVQNTSDPMAAMPEDFDD